MTAIVSRRAFLGGATSLLAGGAVSACTRPGSPVAGPRTATAADGAPASPIAAASAPTTAATTVAARPSDWSALTRDLAGHLIRPPEAGYDCARLLFDPRFDTLRPAGIAYCANPRDVVTCLAFARKFGIPVAARSGGHSYAGWSSTTGLIVDVTAMNGIAGTGAGGPGATATIGAGARLVDVYSALAAQGQAIAAGSCPTVGIAGLTLGGGMGVVDRAYGLTCDNLLSVEIVTPDGATVTASPATHADLFWACQGGGGGNFGVATSFTFRTHPVSGIQLFFLRWPWASAAAVIGAWQSWAPHAPDALWSNVHLTAVPSTTGASGGAAAALQVGGTYLGSASDLQAQLDALYAAVGVGPSSVFAEQANWLHAMLVEAGCASLSADQCHLPSQVPGGRFAREPQYSKSDFFTRPLSSAGIGTMLSGLEKLQAIPGAAGGVGGIALDALGGAVNRVAPGATAFVHRDALFAAQYTTNWTTGASGPGVARQRAWLVSYWQSMRPYASGQAYQNYIDPDLADWRQAYYGANYARLSQVKAAYDPTRLLSFPQAI